MAKKYLLLTATKHGRPLAGLPHEAALQKGMARVRALAADTDCFVAPMNELAISVKDGLVRIHDTSNDRDLSDYDLVHFINASFADDHFHAVALYLRHHGVRYVDSHGARGTTVGKVSQMVSFALSGIRVPDTLSVWSAPVFLDRARSFVHLPCICKHHHGSKGKDNFLIHTWQELRELLESSGHEGYIVQPFIPNEGDYRVLYVGAEKLIFYRQALGESHLNNTSQNGKGIMLDAADCPPDVLRLADAAREAYGNMIAGVDVLVDRETNIPYVLEVNETPALLGGIFQDEKSALLTRFIRQQLSN